MKIFDLNSKRKPRDVRELHNFSGQFKSIQHLRSVLSSELYDVLPQNYSIGYYEGRHHTKRWLSTDLDVAVLNEKVPNGNVTMWCDAQSSEDSRERSPTRNKKCSRREEKENEIDEVFQDLKSNHGDEYSGPQLRLWARMISNGLHEDRDIPPRVPMITGTPKRPKQESFTEALTGAATAFAKVFASPGRSNQSPKASVGMSPSKVADVRMKHLEQLRYIQNLMEDQVLSENEFIEQKEIILSTLRKMT